MKKFEAKSLEEAYLQATKEYECSVTDLEVTVVQQPTKGFLGFGSKSAIIVALLKQDCVKEERKHQHTQYRANNKVNIKNVDDSLEYCQNELDKKSHKEIKEEKPCQKATIKLEKKDEIFEKFYANNKSEEQNLKIYIKKDREEIVAEVKRDINFLFQDSCFNLNEIEVSFYDEDTLYVEFGGEDSALLIGKEGYRYKALSYILFNWINDKYGMMLRLEIAEFLKNQEETIHNYLEPVIKTIQETGSFKTKPLDGILIHIALKRLREEFPNKYVAVKTNQKNEKYVLVNEYKAKQ